MENIYLILDSDSSGTFHVRVVTTESDTADRTVSHTQRPHMCCSVYYSDTRGKCALKYALGMMVSPTPSPNCSFFCSASYARAFGSIGLDLIPLF